MPSRELAPPILPSPIFPPWKGVNQLSSDSISSLGSCPRRSGIIIASVLDEDFFLSFFMQTMGALAEKGLRAAAEAEIT